MRISAAGHATNSNSECSLQINLFHPSMSCKPSGAAEGELVDSAAKSTCQTLCSPVETCTVDTGNRVTRSRCGHSHHSCSYATV
jgi:hypothetical protein